MSSLWFLVKSLDESCKKALGVVCGAAVLKYGSQVREETSLFGCGGFIGPCLQGCCSTNAPCC